MINPNEMNVGKTQSIDFSKIISPQKSIIDKEESLAKDALEITGESIAQSGQLPPLTKLHIELFDEDLKEILNYLNAFLQESKKELAEVDKLIPAAEEIIPENAPDLKNAIKDESSQMIDKILADVNRTEKREQLASSILAIAQIIISGGKEVSPIAEYMAKIQHLPSNVETFTKEFSENMEMANLGMKALILPYNGANLIAGLIQYQAVKKQALAFAEELKKQENPELKEKLKQLNLFLKQEEARLRNNGIDYAFQSSGFLTGSVDTILQKLQIISSLSPASAGFAAAGGVFALLASAWDLRNASKASIMHKEWMQKWTEAGKDLPSGDFNKVSSPDVEALLEKRKESMEKRKEANQKHFQVLLDGVLNSDNFEEVQDWLKAQGISLEQAENKENGKVQASSITTVHEFKQHLQNPTFKDSLLEQYCEHQDTIALSTRNALKSLGKEKINSEKKFFNLKLSQSKIAFAILVLSTIASITLQVLTIAGAIALPLLIMAIPGVGPAIAGMALMGLGLYFLHKYKPNLFKTMFKAVQIRLAFYQIPLAIRKYQLSYKEFYQKEKIAQIKLISIPLLQIEGLLKMQEPLSEDNIPPKLFHLLKKLKLSAVDKLTEDPNISREKIELLKAILENELIEYQLEKKKIDEEVRKLEQKIDDLSEKVISLQNAITRAGAKDFANTLNLSKEPVSKEPVDIYTIMAEGILFGNWKLDEQTDKILKEKMGIDVSSILSQLPNGSKDLDMIKKSLKTFFGMDDSAMLSFFRDQKIKAAVSA